MFKNYSWAILMAYDIKLTSYFFIFCFLLNKCFIMYANKEFISISLQCTLLCWSWKHALVFWKNFYKMWSLEQVNTSFHKQHIFHFLDITQGKWNTERTWTQSTRVNVCSSIATYWLTRRCFLLLFEALPLGNKKQKYSVNKRC